MISVQNQPKQIAFSNNENELAKVKEINELKGDMILVRRRIEQKSLLEIRFARLKRALRSRSVSIF